MSVTQSERASLSQLTKTPYIQVLTYPRISLRAAQKRIRELKKLDIDELVFEGNSKIGRLHLLGIGTVGVVVKVKRADQTCALKIRRLDANRPSMDLEFNMTSIANRVGVGAVVFDHTRDLLMMELLEHQELHQWLAGLKGRGKAAKTREMVHKILNQCRKLDIINLDHGQLSNLRKHVVVVDDAPRIIDFESAGRERKPKNVTTAAQYLFIGSRISPLVRRILGMDDTNILLTLLRDYKQTLSDFSYAKILELLKIPAG